jgi:hypothetical protein
MEYSRKTKAERHKENAVRNYIVFPRFAFTVPLKELPWLHDFGQNLHGYRPNLHGYKKGALVCSFNDLLIYI